PCSPHKPEPCVRECANPTCGPPLWQIFGRRFSMSAPQPGGQNHYRNFSDQGRSIVPMVEWRVRADEFLNCNCAYGCPCQFNALPTPGFCEGAVGYRIHEGHFGDVRLDGLNAAVLVHWPGAIHPGNGTMQLVISDRADARQREALVKIMSGE